MSNDDPFTLDLFNTTTLSSGLGFGVTAVGKNIGAGEPEAEETTTPAAPESQPASSAGGGAFPKGAGKRKARRTARRSGGPPTLTLNRARRSPGPSSCAGLKKPRLASRAGMLQRNCPVPPAPRAGGCLRKEDEKGPAKGLSITLQGAFPWN